MFSSYQWLVAILQYLQCVSNGDIADLHQTIDIVCGLIDFQYFERFVIFHCLKDGFVQCLVDKLIGPELTARDFEYFWSSYHLFDCNHLQPNQTFHWRAPGQNGHHLSPNGTTQTIFQTIQVKSNQWKMVWKKVFPFIPYKDFIPGAVCQHWFR